MYDIRQFKPALYVLVILGITGFSLASMAPGIWTVATGFVLLHAWLDRTGRFKPMPRFIANVVTFLCLGIAFMQIRAGGGTPILLIGNFLVLLQLIKFYELRANRDYAQLLVLSLLLMVAASISTASLLFGLMLIGYLFLSLYCCLLFHLKVETDHAKATLAVSGDKVNPLTLKQDQRYLSSSMRRLTGAVSVVAISTAVVVFLFFPRGAGAGLLGPLQFRPAQTLTGFSDQVSFQQVAKITQNTEEVATVKVWRNDAPVAGTEPLLLRGMSLDVYTGSDNSDGRAFSWLRSALVEEVPHTASAGQPTTLARVEFTDKWRQEIRLKPTGTQVLFAMPGPVVFTPDRDMRLKFAYRDEVLQSLEPLQQPVTYTVVSRNALGLPRSNRTELMEQLIQRNRQARIEAGIGGFERQGLTSTPEEAIDPRVTEVANRAEVSGSDATGAWVARRPRTDFVHALDGQIASSIEKYLRSNFRYTLDLTDARNIGPDEDPIAWFLTDTEKGQRGHCEYFAGAMTLMCQSLGMQARMVVGFKCDDYNAIGGYYSVRQNHAHAWVEVLTENGWLTFDPTSGREDNPTAVAGAWTKFKHLLSYLEYAWASNVVAYDGEDRANVIQNVDMSLTNAAINSTGALSDVKRWLDSARFWFISSTLLGTLMLLMVVAILVAVGWFLWERWQVRRKATRIGIDSLSTPEQIRLVRQLGFYDDLLRLLEKHRIKRPSHNTPLEFSDSLSYMPSEVYDTVRRLTNLFYRIRYGGAELQPAQRKRLNSVIERLETAMEPEGVMTKK